MDRKAADFLFLEYLSMDYLVHLTTEREWALARSAGEYRAPSLEHEGFIHLSRPDQILAVANSFYRDLEGTLLLWLDPSKLSAAVRWEQVGEEVFPHLYGPLNLEAVAAVTPLNMSEDGFFRKLPDFPGMSS